MDPIEMDLAHGLPYAMQPPADLCLPTLDGSSIVIRRVAGFAGCASRMEASRRCRSRRASIA